MPERSDIIEQCAAILDGMLLELEAAKKNARRSHYDKQGPAQVRYAIRWVARAATRIRAYKTVPTPERTAGDPRLAAALAILRELRTSVEKSRDSNWREITLAKIDSLLKP